MSKSVDILATTLKDTNKNLKAVDRMIGEYQGIGEQQGAAMERLKTDLARTSDKLNEERMKRSLRESTQGLHPTDFDNDWTRDRSSRPPTSPLMDYPVHSMDGTSRSRYPRGRRSGVRFYDDMGTDDHIHVLHRTLRDLSTNQQRLERDFNQELTARDKEDYEMRKSLQDLTEPPKNSQIETVLSTVDKRLQCIQDELKVERQTYRKKQDEVTRLSTDLQGVLQQPQPAQPSQEDIEMRARMLRSESQRNQDHFEKRVTDAESRVAFAESHRYQVETELDILNQRLDKAEGGRDALLTQIEEYRRQLSCSDKDKQKLAMLLEQQEDELKIKQKSNLLDEHDRSQLANENRRLGDEVRELRTHLSKSAAVVGDYGGLQRDLDCSEKQRTQLSDHIQVLNKDLDVREKQAAKMVTQLQETMDKYETLEQSRHTTLVQLEDTLKKLQTTTLEVESLQTELTSVQAQFSESESKREDIKIRAQETVKQWKLKCRRLEREVDRFTHSTQQMSERNEQLIRDMENMKTQMNLNTQHVDHARQELNDAAAMRATLEEQLRMKTNEVIELKGIKDTNEDEIKEQRSLIEKYEFELHLSTDKYSKLFDEKVSVEDQVFGIQQQCVMLQNQILQQQKDLKEASGERVLLASQLADAVSEKQSYKHSLQDAKKLDSDSRSEIEALMRRLKEEKEYYQLRVEAMKREMEDSQMKDAQIVKDLTHRFKKEHAEYEAELQALKIELHELRANSKQSRKSQEKHKEEIERLHRELVMSKEETAEAQKKYHQLKEDFYNKSQMGEDSINRTRELDLELLNMKEDLRKQEKDQNIWMDSLYSEINGVIEVASQHPQKVYTGTPTSQMMSMDPHKWLLDVKNKLTWLRSELLTHQQEADRLMNNESKFEKDYHRRSYLTELNNHHNVLNQVSQFRREIEEKDMETSQEVDTLQEQVGLLTENLVAERDTIFSKGQEMSQQHLNDLSLEDIRSERQRINDRYARLQETVTSLKKELRHSTHQTSTKTNNNNNQPHSYDLRQKNDTSPGRRSNHKVVNSTMSDALILTPPDLDDSRPLDTSDLLRARTPPVHRTISTSPQKTPPPLSLTDDEFRHQFIQET